MFRRKDAFHLVVVLATLYFLVMTYVGYARHNSLNSYYFDLGIYARKMYLILNSETFAGAIGASMAGHAEQILFIVAPIYSIFPNPVTLIAIQNLLISSGAIILFLMFKERYKIGFLMTLTYLIYAPIVYTSLFEFHPIALAIPLILIMYYSFQDGKDSLFYVSNTILALLREDVALTLSSMNLFFYFKRKEKKYLYISIISLAYFFVILSLLTQTVPQKITQGYDFGYRYSEFGNSFSEIAFNAIKSPQLIIKTILTYEKISYILQLSAPLLLTSFFSSFIFVSVPSFATNLLSSNTSDFTIKNHHSSIIIPILFLSTYKFLLNQKIENAKRISAIILGATIILTFFLFFIPNYGKVSEGIISRDVSVTMQKIKSEVPSNSSLAVDQNIYPHFTNQFDLRVLPTTLNFKEKNDIIYVDYVIFDRQMARLHEPVFPSKQDHLDYIDLFIEDSCYEKIIDENDIILLRNIC